MFVNRWVEQLWPCPATPWGWRPGQSCSPPRPDTRYIDKQQLGPRVKELCLL